MQVHPWYNIRMKVALVHGQLAEFGGAERVFVAIKELFPEAHVYTSFYNPERLGTHADQMKNWDIRTSWAQRVPGLQKLFSPLRFITPYIWESFDFTGYDLVISSSGGHMCKGIITRPETKHICYLHHQPRYLYYYETAIEWQKYWPIRAYGHLINHGLRTWDYLSSQRPDMFIANSEETKRRIAKFYRRDSEVIYPPIQTPKQTVDYSLQSTVYYVTLSRLTRAKHIEVLIEAANKEKFPLKVIGSGKDKAYLQSIAGPSVEFLGGLTDTDASKVIAGAKAFLNAAVDEEFGMSAVEAMSHGTPVVAYASGGLKETVKPEQNGYLFHELNASLLLTELKKLTNLSEEKYMGMRAEAAKQAEKYTPGVFKQKLQKQIEKTMSV